MLQRFVEIEHAIMESEKKFMNDNFHVKSEQLEQLDQFIIQMSESLDQTREEA